MSFRAPTQAGLLAALLLGGCALHQPASQGEAGAQQPPAPAAALDLPPASGAAADAQELPTASTAPAAGQDLPPVSATPVAVQELPPVPTVPLAAAETGAPAAEADEQRRLREQIDSLCEEIGNKLGSVSVADCLARGLSFGGAYSVNERPLALRDYIPPAGARPQTRVLIMGGVHGDEYSSISIMFKWMELLEQEFEGDFAWRFLPAVNPDGLLDSEAVRQNANGVDLNRNFPSRDWKRLAHHTWVESTGRNPRRFPGEGPASEPEVQWVVQQIESFRPDVIVSVHAPYHLLDFDGPSRAPKKIGELYLHQLGVYPGSLGNYGGIDLGLPVVTLELPSAGIMPSRTQIDSMWRDLVQWLHERSDPPAS